MADEVGSLCSAEFLVEEKTEFNADSVEWCPFPHLSEFLACGTYHLNEGETAADDIQTRNGAITLYQFFSGDKESSFKLEKVDVVDSGGVLDMKWCPKLLNGAAILGAACSNGKILLNQFSKEDDLSKNLQSLTSINLSKAIKRMVLSLDWSCEEQGPISLITSDTSGNLNYLVLRETELYPLENWNAHSFESWIAAFDYSQPHLVYSGGDDCCLKCWDTRSLQLPVFINKRHSMGVTAISKSKKNEYLLATGSYDENIFLWDTRCMKVPLSEISLSGGIWRLKWHPSKHEYLLSASMHNGFHVVSVADGTLNMKVHYDKHESLAYGVDWCNLPRLQTDSKENRNEKLYERNHVPCIIASCSFYDKLLHIWRIKF